MITHRSANTLVPGTTSHCRRRVTTATAIVALVLASGCASVLDEDGAVTVVPYEIVNSGQIVVSAEIDDHGPFTFAFDTGASISVVFDDVREDIGLECVADRMVVIQGLLGSGKFPLAIIDRLQLGNAVWEDARLASMPGGGIAVTGIDGIFGVDLLDQYAVSLSTKEKALRLYAPESLRERSYKGWEAVPLHELSIGDGSSTVYGIEIRVGSVTIPALLDLGAASNIMNWRAARELEVRPRSPRSPGEISGTLESVPVAAQIEIDALKTGNLRWSQQTFVIADFPVFSALGIDSRPMAIVGAGLFDRRDFVIDFARQRLLVKTSD